MSSLILELQREALSPSPSVINLLRKALMVATELEIKEFQEWIELEIYGYINSSIPGYRTTRGQIRGWNPFHGWQPIIVQNQEMLSFYENLCNIQIRQPISELVALIENGESNLVLQLSPQLESILVSSVETKVKISFSSASIKRVVNSVIDTILSWVIKLKKDGIMGEGLTFSQEEKQIAASHNYSGLIIKLEQSQQMQNSSSQNQFNSETFNNDLQKATIGNFSNQVRDNSRQVASNFSQNIGQNADEILKLISSLREIAQDFPEAQREEAIVHLDDLQEDIITPEKQKPQRIKARIVALLALAATIASVVAGSVNFSNNVLELSNKLGFPIDLTQLLP